MTTLDLSSNNIGEIGPLSSLLELGDLDLSNNDIDDLGPLVRNPGLAAGDTLRLAGNSFDVEACCSEIRALTDRGVEILDWDVICEEQDEFCSP